MISRIFWPDVGTAEGLWDGSPRLSNVSLSQRLVVLKVYTSDSTELIRVFAVKSPRGSVAFFCLRPQFLFSVTCHLFL